MRKFRVIWSEYKFYVPPSINGLASLTAYTVGYHLSSGASASPLARSGAAATAISVGFAVWNYRQILLRGQQRGGAAYEAAIRGMNLQHQDPDELIRQFRARLAFKTTAIDCIVTWMQAGLLMLATLVWGFGDLANRWM